MISHGGAFAAASKERSRRLGGEESGAGCEKIFWRSIEYANHVAGGHAARPCSQSTLGEGPDGHFVGSGQSERTCQGLPRPFRKVDRGEGQLLFLGRGIE